MKTKNKPHYGLWRNTGFMVALAWKECKSVLVITLALALTMTAKSVVQLLVAPAILGEVEAAAPVPELLLTIAIFGVKTRHTERSMMHDGSTRASLRSSSIILRRLHCATHPLS